MNRPRARGHQDQIQGRGRRPWHVRSQLGCAQRNRSIVRCTAEETRKANQRGNGARKLVGKDATDAETNHEPGGYSRPRTKHFLLPTQGKSKVRPGAPAQDGTSRKLTLAGTAKSTYRAFESLSASLSGGPGPYAARAADQPQIVSCLCLAGDRPSASSVAQFGLHAKRYYRAERGGTRDFFG